MVCKFISETSPFVFSGTFFGLVRRSQSWAGSGLSGARCSTADRNSKSPGYESSPESLHGGFVNTNFFTGTANTTNPALDTPLTFNKDEKATTDIKVEFAMSKFASVYFLVRNAFNSLLMEFMRGYLPQYRSTVLPYRYFEFGEPQLSLGLRVRSSLLPTGRTPRIWNLGLCLVSTHRGSRCPSSHENTRTSPLATGE